MINLCQVEDNQQNRTDKNKIQIEFVVSNFSLTFLLESCIIAPQISQ